MLVGAVCISLEWGALSRLTPTVPAPSALSPHPQSSGQTHSFLTPEELVPLAGAPAAPPRTNLSMSIFKAS